MIRISDSDSTYYGTAAERAANTGWREGDVFCEQDTGKLWQRAINAWQQLATAGGAGGNLPVGSDAGDLVRFDGNDWYVQSEPAVFAGLVLTPASASLVDAEGALYYNSSDKAVLVCTGI